VEAAGEAFEFAVGPTIEVTYYGEELDVAEGEVVWGFFACVFGVKFCLIVIHEAEAEDEFSSADEFYVDLLPVDDARAQIAKLMLRMIHKALVYISSINRPTSNASAKLTPA